MKRFLANWLFSSIFVTLSISLPTSIYGYFSGRLNGANEFFSFFFQSSFFIGKFALICFFIGFLFLPKKKESAQDFSKNGFGFKWNTLLKVKKVEIDAKNKLSHSEAEKVLDVCESFYKTVPKLNLFFQQERKRELTLLIEKELSNTISLYTKLNEKEKEETKETFFETLEHIKGHLFSLKK